jgi:phosphodiesterase/alkaline phosphatase D-like protein
LKANANVNKISGLPAGTVNLLLYLNFGPPPPPPSAPDLSSPADGAASISLSPVLSWNVSSGATSYAVQVATDPGFTSIVSSKSGLATTSTTITGLSANTTYYWRVSASNGGGTSVWSTAWSFTTLTVVVPGVPTMTFPLDGATGVSVPIRFSWNSASNAASYHLQVSIYSDFRQINANKAGITTTTVNVGGLKKNIKYYWRVRALSADGVTYGTWANVRSFTTASK